MIVVFLLHQTVVIGFEVGIGEFFRQSKDHIADLVVADGCRAKQIAIEHTVLICETSSFVEGFSFEVNFVNMGGLEFTDGEVAGCLRNTIVRINR